MERPARKRLVVWVGIIGSVILQALALGRMFAVWRRMWRARKSVRILGDLSYVPGSDHPKHRLDLFLPKHEKRFPIAVFVHGGFWRSGDKRFFNAVTGLYSNAGVALAERGVAVAVINYRLQPNVALEDQLDDTARSIRFTRDEAVRRGGDPKRLFLIGHSAGAHLVTTLAADAKRLKKHGLVPEDISGVVAISGVFDLDKTVAGLLFGRKPEELRDASPIALTDAGRLPPFLLIEAQLDFPLIIRQSQAFHDALRDRGTQVELRVQPMVDHFGIVSLFGKENDPLSPRIASFIENHG